MRTDDDVHLCWALQGYGMVEFSLASAALKCKQAMEAIENEMRPDSKKAGGKRKAGEAAPTDSQSQGAQVGPQRLVWDWSCHHSMMPPQYALNAPLTISAACHEPSWRGVMHGSCCNFLVHV